jgi:uncharacterized protein YkwD
MARKIATGIPALSRLCNDGSHYRGAFCRSIVAVALVSVSPFSTPAHADRHFIAASAARQSTPASVVPSEAPDPNGRTRSAVMPRGVVVPGRQAAPPASEPRQTTPSSPAPRQAPPSVPEQRASVASAADQRRAPAPYWLAQINAARASAGLLPVVEEDEWSAGGVLHSRYMVKNNYVGHDEETSNAWYTPEGRAAGQNGNAYANYAHDESDPPGIDAWLTTPFHLINVLDPRLAKTGFGWYREGPGDAKKDADPDAYQIGATLDVARGIDADREPARYPVFFPGNGQTMPYSRYFGSEHPDPLTSCPDRAFQGAPLLVQLDSTPKVTSVTVMKDGLRLDRCVFDETSYKHDDAETQALGREVLAGRHAVVIMPREPLTAGIYRVTLVSGGVTHSWAFGGPERDNAPRFVAPDAAVLPFSASPSAPAVPMLAVNPAAPASSASAVAPVSTTAPVRAVACSPRPVAGVGVIRESDDRLLTLVSARGANNELRQLHFGQSAEPLENAAIELNGYPAPIVERGTVTLPPGTTQFVFAVQRVSSGQPMRAPFTITDTCGDWPSVVEAPTR